MHEHLRVQCRIVLGTFPRFVSQVENGEEFFGAALDILAGTLLLVTGHPFAMRTVSYIISPTAMDALAKAGWLHRDINLGCIFLVNGHGVLCEIDACRSFERKPRRQDFEGWEKE